MYMINCLIISHNKYFFDRISPADLERGTFSNKKHVRKHAPYADGKLAPLPYLNFYTSWLNSDVSYCEANAELREKN